MKLHFEPNLEHHFAEQMEQHEAVKVYAKLPSWFIGAIGGAMICGTFWSFLGLLFPPPVLLDIHEDSLAEIIRSLQCVLWGILYGAALGAIFGTVARFDHVMRFGDGMMGSGALWSCPGFSDSLGLVIYS